MEKCCNVFFPDQLYNLLTKNSLHASAGRLTFKEHSWVFREKKGSRFTLVAYNFKAATR